MWAWCSGHGAMKENHFLDDGTYSASQILVEMVRRRLDGHGDLTEELLSELKEPAEAHEFRLKLKVRGTHPAHALLRQFTLGCLVCTQQSLGLSASQPMSTVI